jgi:hypothetical protein
MLYERVFEPDEEYDRNHASNSVSRYAAYLAQYRHLFRQDGQPSTDAGWFAQAAWQIAHTPTMSPPYVRCHGRVQDASVQRDEDGHQAVLVELAVSSAPEATGLASSWRRWTRDEHGHWLRPDDYAHPTALTVLQIAVPLDDVRLPHPRYQGDRPDVTTAKRAVQAVCVAVNTALACVVGYDPLAWTGS